MRAKINSEVIINEKAIQNDLNKFAKICATTIIEEGISLIMKFATKEMAGYYSEYEPYEYERTYQMYLESFMPFRSFKDNIYEGGINIDAFFTNHKPRGKKFTEEDLYDNVWIKGSHGREIVGYKSEWQDSRHFQEILGTPDRLNRLKKKIYSNTIKNKLLEKGMKKAKSQSYSILEFNRR